MGLILLALVVLAGVITERAAVDVRGKLYNALDLERDLGRLLTTLQDAETGQRGYLLTGRERYLQPYRSARDTIRPILTSIRREVMNDSVQQRRVERVRRLSDQKFYEIERTLRLKSSYDTLAIDQFLTSDRGENAMTEIRLIIDTLREVERQDVERRQRQLASLSTTTTILRWAGVVGLALVFFYLYGQLQPLVSSLSSTNEELEEKNQQLDRFAYIASHDLSEPLRTISNYIEVLDEDYGNLLGPEGKQLLAVMHRSSNRMRKLIQGLLSYSRDGRSGELELVDLNASVSDALENLAVSIRESGAEVTVESLPTVPGYALSLQQLFQNLIANAIKFRRPDHPPEIRIWSTKGSKYAVVHIQDNGIGIPAEDQERIFSLFTRLHRADIYEGQGIGLAFCQKIVQLHRGSIVVRSKLNEGSTFSISLAHDITDDQPEANSTHR